MFRRLFATILTFVLLVGTTAAAAGREPLGPTSARGQWNPSAGAPNSFTVQGANLLRLQAGAFDPLVDVGPTPAGFARVTEADLVPGVAQYWIVQVRDGRFTRALTDIAAAGALWAGVLLDNAYVVRATPGQRQGIAASTAVRWTGLLQPSWRVRAADDRGPGLVDLNGLRSYRVHLFAVEPDKRAARRALAAIPGVRVLSSGGAVVDLAGTRDQLAAIAAVPAVEWVTLVPEISALNSNARWVIDTGVRDLRAATRDNRLTGAGQTAAVADTGINYKPDQNDRAHIGFRDCGASGCLEADYTQAAPGTALAQLRAVVDNNTNHRKMAAYFDYGATGPEPHDVSSHGTHTAGSVTGDAFRPGLPDGDDGMAPGARLVHQNMGTVTGGLTLPSDIYNMFAQAYRPRNPTQVPTGSPANGNVADYANYVATEDARTHNNSWSSSLLGVPTGERSVGLDRFVWDHEDMVIVVSAGNNGPEPTTLGDPAMAKNNFDSAASANGRQPMASIDSLASFSAHGPTRDLRFGPTVATPGQIVVSSKGGSVEDYHYAQGTSMSAPVLTGATTLIRQYFWDGYGPAGGDGVAAGSPDVARRHNPSASLVRAAAVNGAVRMQGYYTGDDGYQRELDGQWPSAGQGFGLLNLDNSLYFSGDPINNWYHDVWRADTDAFAVTDAGEIRSYQVTVAAGQPLDVTLSYTDAPNLLPQGTPALINNLDLTVVGPAGTYVGNNFNSRLNPQVEVAETPVGPFAPDTRNNIERIRIAAPAAGTYTINVTGSLILQGRQGFALAASGLISAGTEFVPGTSRQADQAGNPVISGLTVEPVSSDMAIVRFNTNEPTTASVSSSTGGTPTTWIDSYNRGPNGFPEYDTVNGETSEDFANRPVVSTEHEILVTGLSAIQYAFTANATDLADNDAAAVPFNHRPPAHIFQPDADDEGNLQAPAATPAPPPAPPTNVGWRTAGQVYAGAGLLGAFGFRVPDSVDLASVTGAIIEFSTGHQWTIPYSEDQIYTVDLLDESVEPEWGTQTYEEIHSAPADARFRPESTVRDGLMKWRFYVTCGDLAALKATLGAQTGDDLAAFRYDVVDPEAGVLSVEPGFNRRSRGPQYRPRLILLTQGNPTGTTTPCNPNTPAPTITDVGIDSGVTEGGVTVSWRTNVPSDSTVIFRRKGTTAWTQVGNPSMTTVHQVQVLGLDPTKEYEFGVRSAACNGATRTADNGGAGWDFFYPPVPEQEKLTFWFHGSADDQATKLETFFTSEDGLSRAATFSTAPPDGSEGNQTTIRFNPNTVAHPLEAYWIADASPQLTGAIDADVNFAFALANSSAGGFGVEVGVWTAVDAFGSDTARKIGSGLISISGIGPEPQMFEGKIHVEGVIEDNVLIQLTPQFLEDDATQVSYDTTALPSRFEIPIGEPPPQPDLPTSGPVPPPSAESSGLNLASVPTRGTPTAADVAAGTGRCFAPQTVGRTISIGDVTVNEAAGNAQLTVTLSGTSSQAVTVNYATQNGTAIAGRDYTSRSGTLTFQPGQTSKVISVPITNDTKDEANETFFVNLSSAAGASIADARGRATITDNDPLPSLAINDVTVTERDSTSYATFTVSLTPASGRTVQVDFATENGTARAPDDYTQRTGTLTFNEDVTTRTVRIAIRGENLRETTENFFVNLTNPVNATIADARGRGTIRDDDPDDPLVVLTKSGPEEAQPGEIIRYALSWQNLGPFASQNARITDVLPAEVSFYSAGGGGTYDRATRTVTWQLGTVPTDGTGTRYLRVRVKGTVAEGTMIINRADFHGDQTYAAPAFARTTVTAQ